MYMEWVCFPCCLEDTWLGCTGHFIKNLNPKYSQNFPEYLNMFHQFVLGIARGKWRKDMERYGKWYLLKTCILQRSAKACKGIIHHSPFFMEWWCFPCCLEDTWLGCTGHFIKISIQNNSRKITKENWNISFIMFHCISNAFIIFHWVSILGFNHDHGSAAELEWVGSHFGDSGEVGHATCPYLSVVFPCRFGLLSHVGTICVSACSCCLWCIRHSASAGRWHYLQRAWAFVSRFAVSETMWDRIPWNILKPRECFRWIAMNMGKYWNYI